MTGRLAAGLAIAAALSVWVWRSAGVGAPRAATPASAPARSSAPPSPGAAEPVRLSRDPFRYADAPLVVREAAPAPPRPAPTPIAPIRNPDAAVRLSGFARQSGVLKAVLNLLGSVVVVGAGETVEGYRVLSVDEERGVRLLQPDGTEITLPPSDR